MGFATRLFTSLSVFVWAGCGVAPKAPPSPSAGNAASQAPAAPVAAGPAIVKTPLGPLAYVSKHADPILGAAARWVLVPVKSGELRWELYNEAGASVRSGAANAKPGDSLHFSWDGKDSSGRALPRDAYYLSLRMMGDTAAVYDPRWSTGGEDVTTQEVTARADSGRYALEFTLPEDSRATVYFGILGGAIIHAPVWGRVFPKGRNALSWKTSENPDGLDMARFRNMVHAVAGYSLPENALLVVSGEAPDYGGKVTAKPTVERLLRPVAVLAKQALSDVAPPRFSLAIKNPVGKTPEGLVEVSGKVLVQVVMDEEERRRIRRQRFEMMFFSDFFGIFEDEEASLPFTFEWDVSKYNPGRHYLTCNIATYARAFGARTLEVSIVKPKDSK